MDEPLLTYFTSAHLTSPALQRVSYQFEVLARQLCVELPRTPERTVALRKLLESKDAAVRAALDLGR